MGAPARRGVVCMYSLADFISYRLLTWQYRAEQSHEATRVRERGMRKFKSVRQAQRFLDAHATVSNLFNLVKHLVRAEYYWNLRVGAFAEWTRAVA